MSGKLTEMPKLVKHEEASKDFGVDLFYTTEPMWYEMMYAGKEAFIYVPAGFLTDGASIPKPIQKILPVWDTYAQAAIFHDYLCEYLTIYLKEGNVSVKISRSEVDKIFNDLMKVLNTNPIKRRAVHAAVVAYAHVRSIIYPSATLTKRSYEDKIRLELETLV